MFPIICHLQLKQQPPLHTYRVEWPKPKTLTTPNVGGYVEQQGLSFIAGGNAKTVQTVWNALWQFLTKLTH